jgi:hypothetical protein
VSEAIHEVGKRVENDGWECGLKLTSLTAIGKDRIGVLATVCAPSAKHALPFELSTSGTATATGTAACPTTFSAHIGAYDDETGVAIDVDIGG